MSDAGNSHSDVVSRIEARPRLSDAEKEAWLFHYVKVGATDLLQAYVADGVQVNRQDESGMTPLHHAVAHGTRPCIRVLVNSGRCDYLIRDNLGRYASDIAIEWSRDFAVARLLSKHQARQAHARGVLPFETDQR